MSGTSSSRAWLAATIAFVCVEAYLVGGSRGACVGLVNMLISSVEVQVIIVNIGIFIATIVGATAVLSAVASLNWLVVTICAACGTGFLAMLLLTLHTFPTTKTWVVGPVLGGAALCALTTLAVRKLPTVMAATLGAIVAASCFMFSYIVAPHSGSGACGFTP